jgi:hypothetical protein
MRNGSSTLGQPNIKPFFATDVMVHSTYNSSRKSA